jgi:cyclopropane fatty-acyl-phospholipid synthase-like methyltransferase
MTSHTKYDLKLFLQLNEEYATKPVKTILPPVQDLQQRLQYNKQVARYIARVLGVHTKLRGKRVLDFGCGRGDLAAAFAKTFDCKVTGVDVRRYEEWDQIQQPNLDLRILDLCEEENAQQYKGQFDVIVSKSALEHVVHPFSALKNLKDMLKPKGIAFLEINLYRGPLASHRYREVFFPWPHLLFSDDVIAEFYEHFVDEIAEFYENIGDVPPRTVAWVNKLTSLHYEHYLQQIGFNIIRKWYTAAPFDEEFYNRFEEKLSRYPRYDLERDFIYVVVTPRDLGTRDRLVSATVMAGSIFLSATIRIANWLGLDEPLRRLKRRVFRQT